MTPLLFAATGGKTLWYLTRGTGVVTLLLLTASVALGVVTSLRVETPRWPRFVTAALHRHVSLLVLVFLAAHIATSVIDGFVSIRWVDAVVPFGSAYRPIWLGLGAVAFDLLIALTVSSLLRERIGYPAWRLIHWTAYACWPLALVHGLGTGYDARQSWMLAVDGASVALVLAAVIWRVAKSRPARSGVRVGAFTLAGLGPVALVAFAVTGPLQPGWQRHTAATAPPAAITTSVPVTAASVPASPSGAGPSGAVLGSVAQHGVAGGRASEVIDLRLTGPSPLDIRVTLTGRRLPDGRLSAPTGGLAIGPPGGAATASGPVTSIQGGTILAPRVRTTSGSTWRVVLRLTIDHARGVAQGTVATTAGTAAN